MTIELSKWITSCLTAVKKQVIKYCEKVYERSGKNLFWYIKNSGEILDKLKARGFNATSLSTYDFSTLYTTLPHNLIKDKLIDLIERTFQREGSPYLACNDRYAFLCLPPLGSGDILFFHGRLSICPSVCLSVCHKSCPLYNLKTAEAILKKLYTNINQHEMTCRVQEW